MLVATNLSKTFGKTRVLGGVDVEIEDGVTTVLVGPSGSGKSTLLGLLSGLLRPNTGAVTLDGRRLTARLSRATIAWIPQGSNVLPHRTTAQNAALGALRLRRRARHTAVSDALDLVGLSDVAHQAARRLSGGELQRLAVARALVLDRRYIFADEPTGNLDAENTQRVVDVLQRFGGQRANLVVATHDPAVVGIADRVIDVGNVT